MAVLIKKNFFKHIKVKGVENLAPALNGFMLWVEDES